jgi:O-acetyl-ADP-ribose deacetylase (regulator of RNase III)
MINKTLFEIVQGDITERDDDAIVNPANADLVLGGGVAGAIRQKGGPVVQAECRKKAPVHVGEAVITSGGNLKARFVIHAVGPRWGEGNEDEKLRSAVYRSLRVADQNSLKSLAMPAISTGIFGFPMRRAAEIILNTMIRYLHVQSSLIRVTLVLYDKETFDTFEEVAEGMEAAGVLPTTPKPQGA